MCQPLLVIFPYLEIYLCRVLNPLNPAKIYCPCRSGLYSSFTKWFCTLFMYALLCYTVFKKMIGFSRKDKKISTISGRFIMLQICEGIQVPDLFGTRVIVQKGENDENDRIFKTTVFAASDFCHDDDAYSDRFCINSRGYD